MFGQYNMWSVHRPLSALDIGQQINVLLCLTGSRIRSAGSRPELTVGLSATPMSPITSSLHQVDDAGHRGIDDILGKSGCIQWYLSIKVGQSQVTWLARWLY